MDPNRPISDIMTTELVSVRPDEPADMVKKIFDDNDFHHIPVTDINGQLEGIISKEDFLRVSYFLSLETTAPALASYQRLRPKDFMTTYPLTINPDDSIGLAADIFLANKFHALPVVEDGSLVGMVTTHDLLAYSFRSPLSTTDR